MKHAYAFSVDAYAFMRIMSIVNATPCRCGSPDCDWLHATADERIRLSAEDWLPVDLPRDPDLWDEQPDKADFADEYARDAEREAAE